MGESTGSRGEAEWIVPQSILGRREAGGGLPITRILFLHGGSYEWYSPRGVYRPFTTRLAEVCGMPVLAIDYRLAPEHCFPAAVEDAVAGLQYMATHQPDVLGPPQTSADQLLVCGDSAGGGLALALLEALRTGEVGGSTGSLAVTGCVTVSAWTDLSCSVDTWQTRAWDQDRFQGDPVLSSGQPAADSASGAAGSERYAGSADGLRHPLASPINTPAEGLAQLPKLLMVVGDAEVLLGDTTEYAARAVLAGATDLTLRVFPLMWHCWPMYCEGCGQFPEESAQDLVGCIDAEKRIGFAPAVDALAEIGTFFRNIVDIEQNVSL